jgi:hypothetical protein
LELLDLRRDHDDETVDAQLTVLDPLLEVRELLKTIEGTDPSW